VASAKKTEKSELGRVLTVIEDIREAQHRFGFELAVVKDQQVALAEALSTFREEMLRKFLEQEARLDARLQVIEQAIRASSEAIMKNSEEIAKCRDAILRNSEAIAVLQAEVREARSELDRIKRFPSREDFDALEKRISELEARARLAGL
jgi:chromosome segregation ATPase